MRRMFTSVLVANRGEIAVRICKTLRKMGIRSVVVASIPDRRSLAVRSADAWVLLEGYSAAESYLDIDAVIAAAKAEGCEAIHPGYGFLSERADFAERCAAEGIVFVGPPPEVLRGMGDKAAARQLAVANGVPVVPGWDGDDDAETLAREAGRIGYPVMLKARGGGGGRGMREVFSAGELPEAIESARREALAAFGDGGLLLEKLVTNAHHVEVQVLADAHGNVIHLGERDCSVQRRHQKLIEETPSPAVDEALRERLTGYALTLAKAIGYVNAGTFEFLVTSPPAPSPLGGEGDQEVYFLEVNPRLQVEHPVTEMVTGLDLVELQLRIAAGEPLPMRQEDVQFEGHAIEFRINAEDPWDGFKPSSGRIRRLKTPANCRVDAGYEERDTVPLNYDSLLLKVVFRGRSRNECLRDVELLSDDLQVEGVTTNSLMLKNIAAHADFVAGAAHVGWFEPRVATLAASRSPLEHWACAAAALAATPPKWYEETWAQSAWLGAGAAHLWLSDGLQVVRCATTRRGSRILVDVAALGIVELEPLAIDPDASVLHASRWKTTQNWSPPISVVWLGQEPDDEVRVADDFDAPREARVSVMHLVPPPPLPRRAHAAAEGATAISAPLAGTIAAVRVAEGDAVSEGQLLVVLEAMKMEHRIAAPADGVVKAVSVRERDVVREGDVLVELG